MKFDVSNQNIKVNGEDVKEIEILYAKLLRNEKNIKLKDNLEDGGKLPLIAYHLKGGGKWEFETKIIVDKND